MGLPGIATTQVSTSFEIGVRSDYADMVAHHRARMQTHPETMHMPNAKSPAAIKALLPRRVTLDDIKP